MFDHFGSGISHDQTCKWGIEWDTCAPGLSCCFASERTLRSRCHHPRNHRFCETAVGDLDGGLPFGAIACFDLATEAADRARSRAATPCKPPPTANTDERFVRLMRRGHGRYCANISKFLVSSW